MDLRVRVFIDFWNFNLNWNDRMSGAKINWPKVSHALIGQSQQVFTDAGSRDTLNLSETRVYASCDPGSAKDAGLKKWLNGWLDRQAGFKVYIRERASRQTEFRCSNCGSTYTTCSTCKKPFRRSPEKGVDSAIVTDLFVLAWEKAFDVAILVTSDADFVPAVETLQTKDVKVINATWRGHGHQLAKVCWASFDLDKLTGGLVR